MDELFQTCPHCHTDETVIAYGPKTSNILIVGSEPEEDDCRMGKPMTTSGPIFKAELGKAGLDYNRMRVCLLYNHKFPKDTHDSCLAWSVEKMWKEAQKKKVVVAVGAVASKYLTGYSTSTHNGLITTSPYLPSAKVLVCIKPSAVFRTGLGELHFAIGKLKELLEFEELI